MTEDSFYEGLLDYPHYTKPRTYKGMSVPDVLVSGDHEQINRWRRRKAIENTYRKRPDLLAKVSLMKEDKEILRELKGQKG